MQTSPFYRLRGLEHLDVKYFKRIMTPPIYFASFLLNQISTEMEARLERLSAWRQAGSVTSAKPHVWKSYCPRLYNRPRRPRFGHVFFLCEAWMPLFSDLYHRNGHLQVVSGMRVLPSPIQRDVKQWWIFLAKDPWVWSKRWSTIKVEKSSWNFFFSVGWMRNGGPRGR